MRSGRRRARSGGFGEDSLLEYGGLVALISAISAAVGAILGLAGKLLLDFYQKKTDKTSLEVKVAVETRKAEYDQLFAEARRFIEVAQREREAVDRRYEIVHQQLIECEQARARLLDERGANQ